MSSNQYNRMTIRCTLTFQNNINGVHNARSIVHIHRRIQYRHADRNCTSTPRIHNSWHNHVVRCTRPHTKRMRLQHRSKTRCTSNITKPGLSRRQRKELGMDLEPGRLHTVHIFSSNTNQLRVMKRTSRQECDSNRNKRSR